MCICVCWDVGGRGGELPHIPHISLDSGKGEIPMCPPIPAPGEFTQT